MLSYRDKHSIYQIYLTIRLYYTATKMLIERLVLRNDRCLFILVPFRFNIFLQNIN